MGTNQKKNQDIEKIIDDLKKAIVDTDKMFDEKSESHPYIIGYLRGNIQMTIMDLELLINKINSNLL